jgi:AraC family transcriptional regulator
MTFKPRGDFHGNTLVSREVAGFTLREVVHASGIKIPKHAHERAHVAFVLRGVFEEKCERKTLNCKPLSVSYLAPGLTHSDDFRNGAHSFLFEISPERLTRVRELLTLNEPLFLNGGSIAWLTMRLYREARRTDDASSLAVEGLALEILAGLSRQQKITSERKPPQWLERAREILHAQFSEPLTHDAIAASVGVHPVHLASTFRQHYKCTIGQYARRLRIECACREISESDAPLADIALSAGFFDQSHLTKVFKQFTGMTPAQFRANYHRA